MQAVRKNLRVAAILPFGVLAAVSASAADYPIKVDCPGWPADTAGQVEARVRTTLLVEGLPARQVGIACGADGSISVAVVSEHGARELPVERRADHVEDDVVATVEAALRQLLPTAPQPSPTASSAPEPTAPVPVAAAPPVTPPTPPPVTAVPQPPAPVPHPSSPTEVYLAPTSELWSSDVAWGADLGMSAGGPKFRYGLALSGRTLLSQPSSVTVQEWGASARLSFALSQPTELRFSLGVGASLLAASPGAHVSASSSTLRSVASLEASVSRPFWLGAFGLSPELGVRFFSGRRSVLVDEREQVVVPVVAPQLALSLIYRLQ